MRNLISILITCLLFQSCSTIYKGENIKRVKTTAYTHNESDHVAYGRKTAIDTTLRSTNKVCNTASDWSIYPVGTTFTIVGSDIKYVIEDYGSALVGTETIDIYCPSTSAMRKRGTQFVDIRIVKVGSYKESLSILKPRSKWSHIRKMVLKLENNNIL